jgi:hypothetical protein
MIKVIFKETIDTNEEVLIIKFAKKSHNAQNIHKLQESKQIATKIVKSNLAD